MLRLCQYPGWPCEYAISDQECRSVQHCSSHEVVLDSKYLHKWEKVDIIMGSKGEIEGFWMQIQIQNTFRDGKGQADTYCKLLLRGGGG